MLVEGYFVLNFNSLTNAKKHFIDFYKNEGAKHLPNRVNYYKKKLGVDPKSIRIMDLQNRWASWSDDRLNFHWKIMLAPLSVIDYVIVHELAHLKERNHTNEFWEIVESVIPDYKDKKMWLKLNGANLDI
jgi:predicted metal-dependent hydrolase